MEVRLRSWPGSLAFFSLPFFLSLMIPVIWQSEVAAVVLKPPGIATQAPAPHASLETMLRSQFAGIHPYIALPHRLDRPVGGLILVAFTKRAANLLSAQFEHRRVTKTYLALVMGNVQEDEAEWEDWLRKVPDEARVEVVDPPDPASGASVEPAVKHAILRMKRLARSEDRSLLHLRPLTGRMHQLRVQAAARGHAIYGDTLYGGVTWQAEHEPECLPRECIALQASALEFHDPQTGKRVSVEAPMPSWATALQQP